MKKVLTKRNAIAAAVASVVIIAAVVATTVMSNALTLDEAKAIAKKEVPSTAEFRESEDEDNKYEVVFYDSANKETFEVEVNKETQKVKKVERQLDIDKGSSTVKLSKSEVQTIVKDRFSGITSISVHLTRDDGLYEYEVYFKSADFYGEASVNPETGAIMESTLKYGTATVIPGGSKDLISYEEAEKAALAEAGGGTVKDTDLADEGDSYYYEVEIIKGDKEYEYQVDASSGKVTLEDSHASHFDSDAEDIDDDNEADDNKRSNTGNTDSVTSATPSGETSSSSAISASKARSIVLAKIPGASIKSMSLHKDDGKSVYEGTAVLSGYEYEFEINAASGVIIDWDKEKLEKADSHSDDDNDAQEDDDSEEADD